MLVFPQYLCWGSLTDILPPTCVTYSYLSWRHRRLHASLRMDQSTYPWECVAWHRLRNSFQEYLTYTGSLLPGKKLWRNTASYLLSRCARCLFLSLLGFLSLLAEFLLLFHHLKTNYIFKSQVCFIHTKGIVDHIYCRSAKENLVLRETIWPQVIR